MYLLISANKLIISSIFQKQKKSLIVVVVFNNIIINTFPSHLSHDSINLHWQFINLRVIKRLNISQLWFILITNKVNGNTLSSVSSTSSNTMNIILSIHWQIIINHQRHSTNINTSRQQISRNQTPSTSTSPC